MIVGNSKLHSNYLSSGSIPDCGAEGRINKLHPSSRFEKCGTGVSISHDMCGVNNRFEKFGSIDNLKTIETNKSNGLSFKGRSADIAYKIGRAMLDEKMPNRAALLAKRANLDKVAQKWQQRHPIITKVINNKHFMKAMKFMNDNALLSDAAIALLYTCVMRPASIAALPTKDDKEKKKNIYQIGHSISTGIIGFATAFAIQTPMKTAIDKVIKGADKYISSTSRHMIKKGNLEKSRTLMERIHQPISLPLKAALTIYLVPKILNVFGLTKNQNTKQNKNEMPYDAFKYFASFKGNGNNTSFQSFSGGLKDAGK